jgi:alpha-L-rhamnosidase
VNDDLFMPGWTDYAKRIYYRTYDVTKLLKKGPNAAGAILGDGWFAGYVGFGNRREHYGRHTRFLGQIVVEYADGTNETIATDAAHTHRTDPGIRLPDGRGLRRSKGTGRLGPGRFRRNRLA